MLDLEFMHRYLPWYVDAAVLTLNISLWGILLSIATGLFCASAIMMRIPVLLQACRVYIELSRNTPLLVQLFFLYFGLPKIGLSISGEWCAIIGVAFLGGSYMAEAIRASLESIPKSQHESAAVLGFTRFQAMYLIIIPQAFALAVPALVANVIFLIKEISVVSAIALADLMYVTKDLIGLYYKTNEALLMLVVSYLIILLPISLLGSVLERRVRHASFGS